MVWECSVFVYVALETKTNIILFSIYRLSKKTLDPKENNTWTTSDQFILSYYTCLIACPGLHMKPRDEILIPNAHHSLCEANGHKASWDIDHICPLI